MQQRPTTIHELILPYSNELSEIYFERMWQDLDDKQSVGTAGGYQAFDIPSLKIAIGLTSVTVYLNQTKQRWDGYVVPLERSIYHMNSWTGSPQILQDLESYQDQLKFPLSPTLAQVARFGVRARRAARNSDWSEALLNFTIALELLFSEKNQTSQAVSRRFAVVASKPTPEDFTAHRKEILSLYDRRRFVRRVFSATGILAVRFANPLRGLLVKGLESVANGFGALSPFSQNRQPEIFSFILAPPFQNAGVPLVHNSWKHHDSHVGTFNLTRITFLRPQASKEVSKNLGSQCLSESTIPLPHAPGGVQNQQS